MLIEQKIYDMVNESIRNLLIERLIKVLQKLPNTQQIDVEKLSKHFKKDRRLRNNIIQNLGGFGTLSQHSWFLTMIATAINYTQLQTMVFVSYKTKEQRK